MVLILDTNLLSSYIKAKCFCFYPSKNPVNGGSLHWIQPQSADAHDKLPSMVWSKPIICFLILTCNKYSQAFSSLAHCFFCDLKLEGYFYSAIRLDKTDLFLSRIFFADLTIFNG